MDDTQLRIELVRLGSSLGVKQYAGQHPTAAAHEFADKMLPVLQTMEDRIVKRLKETI
jgi:hypothetical protein